MSDILEEVSFKAILPRKPLEAKPASSVVKTLIESHSTRLTAPAPIHETLGIPLTIANWQPWLNSLYHSIITALYSGYPVPDNVIPDETFVTFCMVLIQEKCLLVASHMMNDRPAFRPTYLNKTLIPDCLRIVLDKIGACMIYDGGLQIFPQPDPTINQAYLDEQFQHHFQQASVMFNRLMNNAAIKLCCNASFASINPQGSPFWALAVFSSETGAIADGEERSVTVKGLFSEASPEDVVIAAIIQNRYVGIICDDNANNMSFTYADFHGIHGMREYFNTHP